MVATIKAANPSHFAQSAAGHSGRHQCAHNRDPANRVSPGHQRCMQRLRHLADHLEPNERGEYEYNEVFGAIACVSLGSVESTGNAGRSGNAGSAGSVEAWLEPYPRYLLYFPVFPIPHS